MRRSRVQIPFIANSLRCAGAHRSPLQTVPRRGSLPRAGRRFVHVSSSVEDICGRQSRTDSSGEQELTHPGQGRSLAHPRWRSPRRRPAQIPNAVPQRRELQHELEVQPLEWRPGSRGAIEGREKCPPREPARRSKAPAGSIPVRSAVDDPPRTVLSFSERASVRAVVLVAVVLVLATLAGLFARGLVDLGQVLQRVLSELLHAAEACVPPHRQASMPSASRSSREADSAKVPAGCAYGPGGSLPVSWSRTSRTVNIPLMVT